MSKENYLSKTSHLTVLEAIYRYLDSVNLARSAQTARSYRNGVFMFIRVLKKNGLNPDTLSCPELPEDAILWLLDELKNHAATTERLYLTAVNGFYVFLSAQNFAYPNLQRIKLLISQRARRPVIRLPQFPRQEIEIVVDYATSLLSVAADDKMERLRLLRDRAFILTLADTGLRVHEACGLRRGDIDWQEQKAIVIGKGNREAVIRFSKRSLAALKEYLSNRAEIDGAAGRVLTSLPLFARHDKGTGRKIKPITPTTGRNIIAQRVREALGEAAVGRITPHSFRHYFVTVILRGSGGNLKLAQSLARHRNIAVTQRYAHLSDDELDRGYSDIFDET